MELEEFLRVKLRYIDDIKSLMKMVPMDTARKFNEKELENIMKHVCRFEGNCLPLSMYLCALLLNINLNAYVIIIKPKVLNSVDHHAMVVIFFDNKTLVLDPMSYCIGKLPWSWKMTLNRIHDLESIIGDIVVLFNNKEAFIKLPTRGVLEKEESQHLLF